MRVVQLLLLIRLTNHQYLIYLEVFFVNNSFCVCVREREKGNV